MSEITGMLAIGNGEKCPFCELVVDEDMDILKHMIEHHKTDLNKTLFGDTDNG